MSTQIEFRPFAESIATARGQEALLPVIEKELLHYEIMLALDKAGLLANLVFQGGTSLRLCYGSERFSEDLDFAGGTDFDQSQLVGIKEAIERAVTRRYHVEITIKSPRQTKGNKSGISVDKWQIQVITVAGRPDIPQQRIKLEVAAVPAHTRTIRNLRVNYQELPSGYQHILIPVETTAEIMADKLVALVTAKGLRYRDIWDLRWLSVLPGQDHQPVKQLVDQKLNDYAVTDFPSKCSTFLTNLPDIVEGDLFLRQMERFIPADTLTRTLIRPEFRIHLIEQIQDLYQKLPDANFG
jgi:predicted nucleotidyltransferase component of viral defense system